MNLTALLSFESMQYHGAQTQSQIIKTFVGNSIRTLIEQFFLQIAPSFIMILSCRRPSPLNFYMDLMQQIFNGVDDMIIQLVYVNHTRPERIEGPRLHNLLLVDSLEAFLDIDIISYTADHNSNEYYYIFLQQRDHSIPHDMQAIFEYCWINQLINCNVQIQNSNGEVVMYTYFPYTSAHCGHVVPQLINEFVGHSWKHSNFFPLKLGNFYQCPLIAVVRNAPPFLMTQQVGRGKYKLSGLEGNLLQQLAEQLNFTIDLTFVKLDDRTGNYCCGALAPLRDRKAHLGLGYYRQRYALKSIITTTFPHYQSTVVASILLSAHNLTTFQILSFPFEYSSWLTILVFFFCTLLAMELVKKRLRKIALKHSLPYLFSILAVTLGAPLTTQPSRLHKRLIYLSWIWTTFVLRSIYSALLYHLFRHHMHQALPATLLELLHRNYAAVLNRFTLNDILEIPYFDQFEKMKIIVFNSTNEVIALPYMEDHFNENMVAVTAREFLLDYVNGREKPGMFHVLPEVLMHQQLTIYLPKHSFLVKQFDRTLMAIQAVGLTDFWTRNQFNDKYFKSTHLYGEKMLGQRELVGIYVITSIFNSLAVIVFILEVLSKRLKSLRRLFQ